MRFTLNDKKAQRYLIGGLEQVVALHKDVLLPRVPALLKLLYDLDILQEASILEWAEKVSDNVFFSLAVLKLRVDRFRKSTCPKRLVRRSTTRRHRSPSG